MSMTGSLRDVGSDEIKENDSEICSYCAYSDKIQSAIHFCFNCGAFGRYLCSTCLRHHNLFIVGHDIQRIGATSTSSVQEKEEKLKKLEENIQELMAENVSLKEQTERKNKESECLQNTLTGQERHFEYIITEISQLQQKNSILIEEKKKLEAKIGTRDYLLSAIKKERDDLETSDQAKGEELTKLEGNIKQLQTEYWFFKAHMEQINKEKECLQNTLMYQRHKLMEMSTNISELLQKNSKLNEEKNNLEAKIKQMEDQFNRYVEKINKDYKRKLDDVNEHYRSEIRTRDNMSYQARRERNDLKRL